MSAGFRSFHDSAWFSESETRFSASGPVIRAEDSIRVERKGPQAEKLQVQEHGRQTWPGGHVRARPGRPGCDTLNPNRTDVLALSGDDDVITVLWVTGALLRLRSLA